MESDEEPSVPKDYIYLASCRTIERQHTAVLETRIDISLLDL
jgi:hypothetical protein